MKIAGVVNDYKEALDIEDIVKVFIIEKRILNLPSFEKRKKFENVADPNIMVFPTNDIQNAEAANKKNLNVKNDEDSRPVFNVRGLV